MSLKRKAAESATDSSAKKPKANSTITAFFQPPKSSPASASTSASKATVNGTTSVTSSSTSTATLRSSPTPAEPATRGPFDKEAWAKKLTDEQRELLGLEIGTLHESWFRELKDLLLTKDFLDLKRFLKKEHDAGKKIFPPADDVYSWSRHTPFSTVKVVILGQDPYHNHNQAHGLAFSVRPPTPAPPSLKNIYKALLNDYPSFKPPPANGGLLTPWADRGVLLLNTCLTVRAHEANSHSNRGWEKFTQKIIDLVATKRGVVGGLGGKKGGVVFMAWGTPAQKRIVKVDKQKHLVLCSVHPSPLSASRGWFDCGHFKKANEWLAQRYGEEDGVINWSLDVKPEQAGV